MRRQVALLTQVDPDPSHEPVDQPMLFRWQYTDGTRSSMLFAGGLVGARLQPSLSASVCRGLVSTADSGATALSLRTVF